MLKPALERETLLLVSRLIFQISGIPGTTQEKLLLLFIHTQNIGYILQPRRACVHWVVFISLADTWLQTQINPHLWPRIAGHESTVPTLGLQND